MSETQPISLGGMRKVHNPLFICKLVMFIKKQTSINLGTHLPSSCGNSLQKRTYCNVNVKKKASSHFDVCTGISGCKITRVLSKW